MIVEESNDPISAVEIRRQPQRHCSIVLFYKYFLPCEYPILQKYPRYYEEKLIEFQNELCMRLNLKGRLLLAAEGINGTLSAASPAILQEYIQTVEKMDLIPVCGIPDDADNLDPLLKQPHFLFADVDWKMSTNDDEYNVLEPFPDLKISIVKEIISTGEAVSVDDIQPFGGEHLDPVEFHETLRQHPDAVLIDVRNTFEYDIGHFINPQTNEAAINPKTVNFSAFDSFCVQHVDELKNKKVLMYCTVRSFLFWQFDVLCLLLVSQTTC